MWPIEFMTGSGQRIRGVPVDSDVGMLDRSGQQVTVLHDRDRPEVFIAPKNGRSMTPVDLAVRIVFSPVFLGFAASFLLSAL